MSWLAILPMRQGNHRAAGPGHHQDGRGLLRKGLNRVVRWPASLGRAAQQRAPDREQSIRMRHQTSEQALVASSTQQGNGCRGSATAVPLVR